MPTERMTTGEVRAFLGLAASASVHRTMRRRVVDIDGAPTLGVTPVARQPGRGGQDLWDRATVLASRPTGPGARTDHYSPSIRNQLEETS